MFATVSVTGRLAAFMPIVRRVTQKFTVETCEVRIINYGGSKTPTAVEA